MTTTMSTLPVVLVDEILARVPITSLRSLRSTCKKWEASSKTNLVGGKATARKSSHVGFILIGDKICSMKLDLNGGDDFVDTSVNQVSAFDGFAISQLFHCDGLLFCISNNHYSNYTLMVCNMYLGETRLIQNRSLFESYQNFCSYAFGYDSSKNRNHKILRNNSVSGGYEIYSLKSDSWKDLNVDLEKSIHLWRLGSVSLKGNAYFRVIKVIEEGVWEYNLLCFDFTRESFGKLLSLPFESLGDEGEGIMVISCVRDDHLAVLYQRDTLGIWISTEIEPNKVSWREFLQVDLATLDGFPDVFIAGRFIVDEEKQVVVVFGQETELDLNHGNAFIFGRDGYFTSFTVGDAPPEDFTSYVPSLVSLQIDKTGKRKARDD
ncbi:putative F-box domain-containing protein [Arabidopsis thaliana]|uniref:F-box protein At1g11810 n=3 Tax=Arabidopsis TaxID=3701 RepID=FB5_ARATH|nr:F-box associated ubiquitination effector family protein [Arabidopsis thaliana]Q9SA94.1 RecName: Full=F-box protein At1g11810 [Arabidopsis thaliana]KAG7645985.1 F-box domain [Arabidopsis thaliana x Arabidopsis arenosa]AAD30240.1 EST gb/AA605362 comes from this gene [Arabidopsis thaliana]ABL66798.1 At1g11810 [Arabidopsis thaliana]AEE28789.1 F-box associated ubiquitination effector family protein [Arabidopsis thaliana]OAP13460.1 hypothetical protein AXX17_AT1G12180 [Arabidopsis thaliana]|eukprot:NP_172646.3 F-box associated ubiquitination effector family protein [Arabidopsis thaliana]